MKFRFQDVFRYVDNRGKELLRYCQEFVGILSSDLLPAKPAERLIDEQQCEYQVDLTFFKINAPKL